MELGKGSVKQENYKPEDIYEPEMAVEDDSDNASVKTEVKQEQQVSCAVFQ